MVREEDTCLKIAASFNPPFSIVYNYTPPYQIGGFLVDVFDIISQYLHTCYRFVLAQDGLYGHRLPNGTITGTLGIINRSEADLSTLLTLTWERTYYTDFSAMLMMDDFKITHKRPMLEADLGGFIKPFTLQLWLVVLASLLVTFVLTWGIMIGRSIILHQLRRQAEPGEVAPAEGGLLYSAERSILWTYSHLLGQSVAWEPRGACVRVLPGVWLLATLILGSVYRSNLKAMLILPRVRLPFDTLQELAASHVPLFAAEGNAVHQAIMDAEEGSKLWPFKGTMVASQDVLQAAKDTREGRIAGTAPNSINLFYMDYYKSKFGRCMIYVMSETVLGARPMVLMIPKGSRLKTSVDRIIVSLVEMGIMDHLMMRSMPNASVCMRPLTAATTSIRTLKLADFYGALAIYCGGIILASLSFALEVILATKNVWRD
ncbi:glutamate receptor ionotropic, delta-1-like [Panulirus ornatus]|uniref:glutamate receptor ionotropic, delta-1-like n=1 Tax=Panulirus ornatus TaxID=150431 RepID=UPI003A8AF432